MYVRVMFGKLFGKKTKDEPEAPAKGKAAEAPAPPPVKAPPAPPPVAAKAPPPQAPPAKAPVPPPQAAQAKPAPAPAPAAPRMAPVERPAPAPTAAKDGLANLARDASLGAAGMADEATQIENAIRAAVGVGAPGTPDAVRALRAAAEALVASPDSVSRTAINSFLAGRLGDAYQVLRDQASGTDPQSLERLRRLGALAFLVDVRIAQDAYEAAYAADRRDFWGCIYVARLRGLTGRLDGSKEAAEAALAEARTPRERSQAESELALIALGRSDGDAARRHSRAGVETMRAVNAPDELAPSLTLLGDVSVMLGDYADAGSAYQEALSLYKSLGAAAPSDINIARSAADTQEKIATVISRQGRHQEAVAASAESVELRRRLLAARPGEVAELVAMAMSCNTFGDVRRSAGDLPGARTAFIEARGFAREAIGIRPNSARAHREAWMAVYRMAQIENTRPAWGEVVAAMDFARAHGALTEGDHGAYQEAVSKQLAP